MKIHFHEPPPAQRVGGLDAAIRSLQSALESRGHTVEVNPTHPRADIVHFHGLWQPAFATRAQSYRAAGIPYVVSPHGMLEPWAWQHKRWKKLPYWHLIEKRWVRHAATVLATGNAEARRLQAFLPNTPIAAIALGLTGGASPGYDAARAALGWAPEERVLVFLSRVHVKKGLDLLLSALAGMENSAVPASRLVIVGPEEQAEYAAQCRSFVVQHAARLPRIEWKGAIWGDDRWRYLQGADLLVLPTHSENFGLVILEALQVGTRVLTTTETPWAETLSPDGGWIVRPETAAIRAGLAQFYAAKPSGPSERAGLAEWAHTHFHWDHLVQQYEELYARVRATARQASSPA
jgi:glycosyltransferase involved in cell wall biosynthesis